MRRLTRLGALLICLTALLAVPASAGAATSGGLKQLSCLSGDSPVASGCTAIRGLQNAGKMAITSDGQNVYVASRDKDAIVAFGRDSSGKLVQPAGITGCYTSNATTQGTDGCSLATAATEALDGVTAVAVSPDGTSLYATTANGILSTFKRASDGTLSYVSDTSSLHGTTGSLSFLTVTVSPDNKTVYLGGPGGYNGILWAAPRDTSGGPSHGNLNPTQCVAVSVCSQALANFASPADVVVTPDSKQVIVAAGADFASLNVLAIDRNTTTGLLAANNNTDHCVSGASIANCATRSGQIYPLSLATAGNGDIYVGGYYSVTLIRRNASNNTIAPVSSADSCAQYRGAGFTTCTDTVDCGPMCIHRALVVGADGKNVFSGTANGGALLAFQRDTSNGAFSLLPAPLGCLYAGASTAGCSTFTQGATIQGMVGDPAGRFVFAAGGNRVFNLGLDRPPVCEDVGASTAFNTSVTVTLSCSDPDGEAVTIEKASDPAHGFAGGVQGNQIGYGPQTGFSGSDSFQYRAVSNGVASDPATATVNVGAAPPAPPGGGGGGGGTSPLTVLSSTTSINSLAFKKFTKLLNLSVNNLPAGATVRVTCKTKKKKQQKKGCPYKSKRFTTTGARAKLNLRKPFKKKKVPVGTKITITITAPGFLGKQIQYTIRKGKIPKSRVRCLSASGKAGSCA